MLEKLLYEYIEDPENAVKNYRLGLEYERIGQDAGAISYFLRASERTTDNLLIYECFLRIGNGFSRQNNRDYTVKSMYNAAIAVEPNRPEAYYLMSKQYEKEKQYFECYTVSEIGLKTLEDKTFDDLSVGYPGIWSLLFQKAVSGWWRGRGVESRQMFQDLFDEYKNEMDTSHLTAVKNNILNLGSGPENYIYRLYDNRKHSKLRHKFPGSERIRWNHSQVYQDMFVLSMLNGKRSGSFLEIGGAGPIKGNNTYLLENEFDWKGISIEFDGNFAKTYREARPKTSVLCKDALTIDYRELLRNNYQDKIVDYLQLDIEPAQNTYECMTKIPFDEYKFRVITYEHDYYADFSRSFRNLSRIFLQSKGYVLVVNDVSFDGVCTFEDWWVHPDLVDTDILKKMKSVNPGKTTDIVKYMLSAELEDNFPFVKRTKEFDWGPLNSNDWFRGVVNEEIFVDDVYQKYVSVKENDVVLDIGASVGPFAWKIKDKNPSKVVCVEPHKELFKTLAKNTSFTCVNKGIGSVDGREVQRGLYNEALIHNAEEANAQEIDTITFKTLLKENNITHVNFMKLDCEGGEYDIFNDENIDWIVENVDYMVGEWHLSPNDMREKFRFFRDKILPRFENAKVLSYDGVDIKHDLHTEWFLNHYQCINIYIDNRVKKKKTYTIIDNKLTKTYIKDKWKYSIAPTLEFTTIIPEKGCIVDCVFCPQRTLVKNYKGERRLSLDNFKKVIDKLPKEIRITFSGFVEPWMNSDCTEMLLYASNQGHPISAFTTLVGVSINDLEKIKHVKYAGAPNGSFTVHLPDQENRAKHPINKKYIETAKHFSQIAHEFNYLDIMCMGTVHESIRPFFTNHRVTEHTQMYSRAGNLIGERILKPELKDQNFLSVDHGNKIMTCGCDERLYHNVMLPNGDVSLCCMDYGIEEITGNLFTQDYNDVIPDPYAAFNLCRKCENGIEVESRFIKAERKMYNV